ncbi:MAG TPA: hypothetical protein VMN79_04885 [Casimicrobiaceae bacterium]|nr:hypothetical protein [Casimicrobiaceae bacterium]
MHKPVALPALLALLAPAIAGAEPIDALKPMAFLGGHCWKGQFADGKQTDEHCFQWLYDGRALRDTHTVRAPGRPDYVGETTYYFDSVAKRVDWLYIENLGGVSRGTMQSEGNALVFPPTEYLGDGQAMTYRVRWTPVGPDAYEAWSEAKTPGGWATMFKLTLVRTDGRP